VARHEERALESDPVPNGMSEAAPTCQWSAWYVIKIHPLSDRPTRQIETFAFWFDLRVPEFGLGSVRSLYRTRRLESGSQHQALPVGLVDKDGFSQYRSSSWDLYGIWKGKVSNGSTAEPEMCQTVMPGAVIWDHLFSSAERGVSGYWHSLPAVVHLVLHFVGHGRS
jgi:hypothetical protein